MAKGSSQRDKASAASTWAELADAMRPLDRESLEWLRKSGLPGTDGLPKGSLPKIGDWPEESRILFLKALCGDWDSATGNKSSASTSTT